MKNRIQMFIAGVLFLTSPSMTGLALGDQTSPEWSKKMQGIYQSLSELLTNISSEQRFNDPKNKEKIENQIKEMTKLAHDLGKKDLSNSKADPAVRIFAGHLQSEANDAYQAFREGRQDYARGLIRSMTASCIACHSRNSSGPRFEQLPISIPETELKPIERARFFSASRQFDRAVEEYLKIIKTKDSVASTPWEWEEAARQVLAIAVRVKRDPELTLTILKEILNEKNAPQYFHQYAIQWKLSAEQWQADHREIKTEEGLYAEAQRLMALAKKTQEYPLDHSADLLYLRISSILYDLLEKAPEGRHVSDALLLEGMANESISPRDFENLSGMFYEECIQKAPRSKVAVTCYQHYEQQVYLSFTGSAGTHLPQDIKDKLVKLSNLAKPPEPSKK